MFIFSMRVGLEATQAAVSQHVLLSMTSKSDDVSVATVKSILVEQSEQSVSNLSLLIDLTANMKSPTFISAEATTRESRWQRFQGNEMAR